MYKALKYPSVGCLSLWEFCSEGIPLGPADGWPYPVSPKKQRADGQQCKALMHIHVINRWLICGILYHLRNSAKTQTRQVQNSE